MPDAVVPLGQVHLSREEIEAAVAVLQSGALRAGDRCRELEEEFAAKVGSRYAVSVSSGTAALHVAYLALLEPEDEVIVPAFTFVATASMVTMAGAVPVFADIDPRTFTLDVADAARRITRRTRAIAPVHLFGHPCDIEALQKLASTTGVRLIWDAAQAHGAAFGGRDVGSFDDVVCYSFYPTKNMTTGEGGMITMNDTETYERCRLIRSHGQSSKYHHTILGLNYRLTDVAASIGLMQLHRLDDVVNRRRRNAERLTARLRDVPGVSAPWVAAGASHAYNQYTVTLNLELLTCTREEFATAAQHEGVESAVHYPLPLHRQPIFARDPDRVLPNSETVSQRVLSLPVHQFLSDAQVERVADVVETVALKASA